MFPNHRSHHHRHHTPHSLSILALQRLPEVVGVKVPRELLVHVHHVHIALAIVAHDRLRPLAVPPIALQVNPQAAIHLQAQQHLVVDGIPPALRGIALDALQLELLQAGGQVGGLQGEALGIVLGVGGGLCGAELDRVEAGDVGGVVGGHVRLDQVVVARRLRAELPRELLERRLGLAHAQVARLLQRRQGLLDARDGELVRVDVEVVDDVVDELWALLEGEVLLGVWGIEGRGSQLRVPRKATCWRCFFSSD